MTSLTPLTAATVAALASLAYLYADVATRLVQHWSTDEDYSHGFLIVPIALYFLWERRAALRAAPLVGSSWGVVVIAGSLGLLALGTLGVELFLTRVSIVTMAAGVVLYVCGPQHLRIATLPLAFLLLMVPPPAILFNQIAFPLQLLASRFGAAALSALEIPVLREGNIIVLASTTLEVVEACSGIRSLVSLLTVGIVYGYFAEPRVPVRTMLAAATIPVAVLANGLRVAGTGAAAHYAGPEAAEGFFHTFSGWLVFVVSFGMLLALHRLIVWVRPVTCPSTSGAGLRDIVEVQG